MPQYTEYERALRHLRYNEYPPPPTRQYRKWDYPAEGKGVVRLGNNAPSTEIFAVGGTVYKADGRTLAEDGLKVEVTNLTTETTLTSITGDAGPGRYSVTFIDLTGGQVATVGDKIEVKVYVNQLISLATYTVTAKEIETRSLLLDVTPATVLKTQEGMPPWGWALIVGVGALVLLKGKVF